MWGILWDRQKERIIKRWDVRQMWAVFWVLIFDKSIISLAQIFLTKVFNTFPITKRIFRARIK